MSRDNLIVSCFRKRTGKHRTASNSTSPALRSKCKQSYTHPLGHTSSFWRISRLVRRVKRARDEVIISYIFFPPPPLLSSSILIFFPLSFTSHSPLENNPAQKPKGSKSTMQANTKRKEKTKSGEIFPGEVLGAPRPLATTRHRACRFTPSCKYVQPACPVLEPALLITLLHLLLKAVMQSLRSP